MKKTIFIVCLLIVTLIGSSFATTTIELDKAYELLESNNSDILLINEKIKIAEIELKINISKAENAYVGSYSKESDTMSAAYKKEYNVTAKEIELLQLNREKETILNDLKAEVYSKYISVNGDLLNKSLITKQIDELNRNKEIIEKKYELGMETKLNLDKIENSILIKENELSNNSRKIQNTIYEINSMLGLDIDKELSFDVSYAVLTNDIIDYDEVFSNLIETVKNSENVKNAKENLDLAYARKEVILEYLDDDSDYYDDVVDDILDLEKDYKDAKINTYLDVYTAINNLKQAKNQIEISSNTYELNKKIYEVDVLKYDMGQIILNDKLESFNNMLSLYIKLNSDQQNYLEQKKNFEMKYLNDIE